MIKEEIINWLKLNHKNFTSFISSLDEQAFNFTLNNDKWSAGQQLDHIYRSLAPLKLILGLPKWLTTSIFKKTHRVSKSYDELVTKYLQLLESGGRASGRFIPSRIEAVQKIPLISKIDQAVSRLCESLEKYSEEEIDNVALPHPLLGRVTLREMMMFTIYHVEHHHKLALRNLESLRS